MIHSVWSCNANGIATVAKLREPTQLRALSIPRQLAQQSEISSIEPSLQRACIAVELQPINYPSDPRTRVTVEFPIALPNQTFASSGVRREEGPELKVGGGGQHRA